MSAPIGQPRKFAPHMRVTQQPGGKSTFSLADQAPLTERTNTVRQPAGGKSSMSSLFSHETNVQKDVAARESTRVTRSSSTESTAAPVQRSSVRSVPTAPTSSMADLMAGPKPEATVRPVAPKRTGAQCVCALARRRA